MIAVCRAQLKDTLATHKRLQAAEWNLSTSYSKEIVTPRHPWFAALVRVGIPKETCNGAYKEIKWHELVAIDPDDLSLNRKQSGNLMMNTLRKHQRLIHDTITSLFYNLGYTRWRWCSIITGGNKVQCRHNGEGIETSYSVIVALTQRNFTIWHTDGTHREVPTTDTLVSQYEVYLQHVVVQTNINLHVVAGTP